MSSRVLFVRLLPVERKMATTTNFWRHLGSTVREFGVTRRGSLDDWFTNHTVAATCTILERFPLVDLVMEVRDASVPLSSTFEPLRCVFCLHKRVILPNKIDLTDCSQTEIASHPNIYVLDTPDILPPEILNVEATSQIALTGNTLGILLDC